MLPMIFITITKNIYPIVQNMQIVIKYERNHHLFIFIIFQYFSIL
jgi:hypothetical protein